MIGPDSPILALSGQDAGFPCFLSPEISAEAMKVQFYRKELSSEIVLYSHGEDLPSMQTPEYQKRTEFLNGSIAQGNVSLRLKNVTALDAGVYGCRFSNGIYDQIATWELRVSGQFLFFPNLLFSYNYSELLRKLLNEENLYYFIVQRQDLMLSVITVLCVSVLIHTVDSCKHPRINIVNYLIPTKIFLCY